MCGIVGFNWEDKKLVEKMANAIKHRGPDDSGSYTDKGVSLGHRRLSILDLSDAGHQPMFYSEGSGAFSEKFNQEDYNKFLRGRLKKAKGIVFNGEIYNFKELKDELSEKGYRFDTQTDTEVILASYIEWGFDCVKKFNGMWAFCIYDYGKNILFCSRDRLGQKPFYYYLKDGKFIFASELKSILEHKELEINKKENLNKDALQLYFSLGFIPSPYSIYEYVHKLKPSHNVIFDINTKNLEVSKYYDIIDLNPEYDKKKLIKEGNDLLKDSTKIRMRGDVPIGAFLSGGLDSSTVVALMKNFTDLSKLHTFSIGFDGKKYDETYYVNVIRNHFGTIHHHDYFKKENFEELLGKFPNIYDEPFGDYSSFPTYSLSRLAKRNVTVALSGDGGDEIFGGYNTHLAGARLDLIRKLPWIIRVIGSKIPARKNLNGFVSLYSLKKAFEISLQSPEDFYSKAAEEDRYTPEIYKRWTQKNLKKALKKGGWKYSEALRIFDLLCFTLGDNFLVKVDRASMANSLEVRSPFLDYRFIELSQRIPTKWKTNIFKTKIFMREIIKKYIPKSIVKRGKQGFTPPVEDWIIEDKYKIDIEKGLDLLKSIDTGVYEYYKAKVMGKDDLLYKIYKIRLFLFKKWFDANIK